MTAVYRKEVSSFFRTMTGYVLVAFLITFTGIYFMVYNMYQGYPYFAYALSAMMTILMVWIPVLTMRSFAEERKGKTDQLLLTASVKIYKMVLGKYLAMVTVFLIPVLIYCTFPLLIEAGGTAYLLSDYAAIAQFFFIGCSLIAMGMFFSSITESPIIAAVSTFAAILLLYIWENLLDYLPESAGANLAVLIIAIAGISFWIFHVTRNHILSISGGILLSIVSLIVFFVDSAKFENLISTALGTFSVLAGFDNAVYYSIFDVSAIVLQLTLTGVFIFFTIQSIEKRRWS